MEIVKGNDISISWRIYRIVNGVKVPENLTTATDINVLVTANGLNVPVTSVTVSDTNLLTILIKGRDQITGVYALEVSWVSSIGEDSRVAYGKAFVVVDKQCQADYTLPEGLDVVSLEFYSSTHFGALYENLDVQKDPTREAVLGELHNNVLTYDSSINKWYGKPVKNYDRLDAWSDYSVGKEGWVLSAKLGKQLYDTKLNISAISGWALQPTFPGYTKEEIDAMIDSGGGSGDTFWELHPTEPNTIYTTYNVVSAGEISAYGVGSGSSSGGGGAISTLSDVQLTGLVANQYLRYNGTHWVNTNLNIVTSWNELTDKPTTFAPSSHTHAISDVTGLQVSLDNKYNTPSGTASQYIKGDGTLATFPSIPQGTVTSVGISVPVGLSVSNSPITSSGTLALNLQNGYSIPTTVKQGQWDTAFTNNHTHSNKAIIDQLTQANINVLAKLSIVNGNLQIDGSAYATGELSAYGVGSGGGSGGGIIETVYGYSNLGQTFNNSILTDTFNAYTINQINTRLLSVESGSATTVNTTGTGNAITSLTKSGTVITATKGATFSLDNHLHTGVYEPAFTKNSAFNKNFGTTSGTVAQGNDSRINNGQTAYSWGNHASAGYALNSSLSNYVPTSRTITAGNGLTGGGQLTSGITLTLATPSTLTAATTNGVTASSHTHAITTTSVGAANTIVQTDASGGTKLNNLKVGGDWKLEQVGTELQLKYNDVVAQRFLLDGSIVGLGEITAYGASTGGEGVSLLRTGGTMTGNLTMSADIIMNNGRAIGISNLPLKLLGNALTYNASNVLTEANTATQIKMGNGWTIEQTTSALTIKKNGVVKGTFNA